MPNRDAFIEDERPDAAADRSIEDCPPIGTVDDGDHRTAAAEGANDTRDPEESDPQGGGTGGQFLMGDEDEAASDDEDDEDDEDEDEDDEGN